MRSRTTIERSTCDVWSDQLRLIILMAVMLPITLLLMPFSVAAQQDGPDVTWRSYDVTVEVHEGGLLRVTESIVIEFNGVFRQGKRTIPLDRIESIDNVAVSVGTGSGDLTRSNPINQTLLLEHGEFNARRSFGDFIIDYGFDRTSIDGRDNVRTVVISYTVRGAIRDYPNAVPPEQQVRWTAISSEVTETGPVESASATVIFPEPIGQEQLSIDPDAAMVEPDRVVWNAENLDAGDSLSVAVALPPVTAAVAPDWQADADRDEWLDSRLPGIHLVLAIVALVAWTLAVLTMVVRGVRDPDVGLVADIIAERPDTLPAPLVGTLIDERVDTNDVLAGILELDLKGFISIHEDGVDEEGKPEYAVTLTRRITDLEQWQRPMLEGIFGKGAPEGVTSEFRAGMTALRQTALPTIARAYEDELFARGYFVERFEDSRRRWSRILFSMAGAMLVILGIIYLWADRFSGWAWVPLGISFVGFLIAMSLRSRVAMKTPEGAVVAMKWKAYRRYLTDLRKGRNQDRYIDVITQELPWAVALGVQSSWVSLATSASGRGGSFRSRGASDGSMRSMAFGGTTGNNGESSNESGATSSGVGGLQGASSIALSAIGGGSAGMFALLNDAATTLNFSESSGGSSSGGSSGGGGSFSGSSSSGSSGGGGHSFS